MNRISILALIMGLSFTVFFQDAGAHEQSVRFRSLTPAEIILVKNIESEGVKRNLKSDLVTAREMEIAYLDVNGDGVNEIILYDQNSCGSAGCDVRIWKKYDKEWIEIGSGMAAENGIVMLAKTDNGFHELRTGSEILRWNGREYR